MGQTLYPPAPFPIPLPLTLAATTGTWSSGLMFNDGYRIMTLGVQTTQAGTVVITPYIDLAGTLARPAINGTLVANTLLIVDVPATPFTETMPPFACFTLQINNTAGSISTITAVQVILSAG